MRTKLFFAFFAVIIIALVSNLLFINFIEKDFEEYVSGTKEDKLYWILASVEGSYSGSGWDNVALHDALHWAMMLGFDLQIIDNEAREVINSSAVMEHLSPIMKRRMASIIDIKSPKGEYEPYPLYLEGREIGTMNVRVMKRMGGVDEKENIFKERGREFLIASFIIAGGGAVLLSVLFILFLSRPLRTMKEAVEAMAKGDFSVRVSPGAKDELGRLSESFNFMAEALQREESLRRHLTSNIAHELRTPLTVMKANVEAMTDGVITDTGHGLENIRMEVEKLISLVEGIEDITKAEASFFAKRELTELNVGLFLSGLANKMVPLAARKGLQMKVNEGGVPVVVMTDPEKLERIVQNIVTNAIKNTDSGGVLISYGSSGKMFFVEVKDSGKGIPADQQEMVFKRFFRGEGSKGLGLGLAIVKELVDVMGGRIDIKSAPGEGTGITIWLPVRG